MKEEKKKQKEEGQENSPIAKDDASSTTASASAVSRRGDPSDQDDGTLELQRSLMDEAMDNVVVTCATRQGDIHPNKKDIKIDKVSISLFGKELLHEGDINLHWGQRYVIATCYNVWLYHIFIVKRLMEYLQIWFDRRKWLRKIYSDDCFRKGNASFA